MQLVALFVERPEHHLKPLLVYFLFRALPVAETKRF